MAPCINTVPEIVQSDHFHLWLQSYSLHQSLVLFFKYISGHRNHWVVNITFNMKSQVALQNGFELVFLVRHAQTNGIWVIIEVTFCMSLKDPQDDLLSIYNKLSLITKHYPYNCIHSSTTQVDIQPQGI